MRSTPLLIEATPVEGYVVRVRFEDATAADIDLSYLLEYGAFSALCVTRISFDSSARTPMPEP